MLDGQRILITGAARGLGFAFAQAVCQGWGKDSDRRYSG